MINGFDCQKDSDRKCICTFWLCFHPVVQEHRARTFVCFWFLILKIISLRDFLTCNRWFWEAGCEVEEYNAGFQKDHDLCTSGRDESEPPLYGCCLSAQTLGFRVWCRVDSTFFYVSVYAFDFSSNFFYLPLPPPSLSNV